MENINPVELYQKDNIRLLDMDEHSLKEFARLAFLRLIDPTRERKILADWIVLGTHMVAGQKKCKDSGSSYPQWCIDNGYDYMKFGSKGKGLIYSAPMIASDIDYIKKVHAESPNLNNPEHIVYRYNQIKKEEKAELVADMRQQLAMDAFDIPLSDRWRVFHDSIETWQPDKQYDWIITDPPYPKEYLPLFGVLAEKAKEWLTPGGLMVVMSGQMYFQEVMKHLSPEYYWIGAYLTPGQPTPLRHVNVNTTWKPLIFCTPNGGYTGKIFGDVFTSEKNEKEHHKWGQSESGMSDIVSKLCLPGQSILDPFMGAGTTGVAALRHGCLFDGVELLEENCGIAKVRLNDQTMQQSD
ncbi:DNA methyltransferase [bacterium]|nr:DNA methyltransferase [bacterium]